MTPRPPTHKEPTDKEMQCLPEGTLTLTGRNDKWIPSNRIGMEARLEFKHLYAVPIIKREEAQEPRKTLRDEFAMIALYLASADEHRSLCDPNGEVTYKNVTERAYLYADAMLAARNNQPEKV